MTMRFTGWHMLAIMIGFFGTVVSVNVLMASDAIRTFGGTVVDNSYVATAKYNGWLAAGRKQAREKWQAAPVADARGIVTLRLTRANAPVTAASVDLIANHPVGRVAERRVRLIPVGDGLYRSTSALPPGRWLIRIEVRAGTDDAAFEDELRI